jgi:hypothetical protein
MSQTRNKKRKPASKFDFDAVRASVNAKANRTRRVRELINELREIDMNEIVSKGYDLTENEILEIVGAKLTSQGLFNLRKAIQHVPANITRIVDGTAMRYVFILNVFKSLSPRSDISVEEIMLLGSALESYCPVFMSNKDEIQESDLPSRNIEKYLTPPVSTCTKCDKKLSMRNNPSSAVLFTLNGPVPCSKVSLDCRDCGIHFGVCKYSDNDGTRFYPANEFDLNVIEVSNVTYIHQDLYKWMPSLR